MMCSRMCSCVRGNVTFPLVNFKVRVLRADIFTHISEIHVFRVCPLRSPQLRILFVLLGHTGEEMDPLFHTNEVLPSFKTRKEKKKAPHLRRKWLHSCFFSRRRCIAFPPRRLRQARRGKVAIVSRRKFAPWISLGEASASPSSPQEGLMDRT